ncbi:MAG: CPBP family intramembrane glutamic endopeptidase [Verrucomicrobiales bacterium]
MEQAAHLVLADLANCSVLALLLAFVFYALWRRPAGGIDHSQGDVLHRAPRPLVKVACEGYDLIDAVIVFLLIWLWRSIVVHIANTTELTETAHELGGGELLFSLMLSVLLGSLLVFYMVILRRRRLREWLGMDRVSPGRAFLIALGFIIPSFLAVYFVAEGFSRRVLGPLGFEESPQQVVQAFADAPHPAFRILVAVSACCVAPLVEELTFRGFFYPVLKRFTDVPFAALFTALFFGLVHQHLGGFLPLSALGLILVIAYEWTGSLLVPVLVHALFNTTSIFLIWKFGPTLAG